MHVTTSTTRLLALPAIAAAALLLAFSPVSAGGYLKERVYDDSFGNLIIVSPSGYKRIVVGMGYIAAEMEAERRGYAPRGKHGRPPVYHHCYRPPVLWKGRAHMYGLAEGEIPQAPLVCN